MIEAVIDTNVFIDAVFRNRRVCQLILRKEIFGEISFAMSIPICDEVTNIFFCVANDYDIPIKDLQKYVVVYLNRVLLRSHLINVTTCNKHSSDREDDKFIQCAIDGGIKYIVSSDNEGLLSLNEKIKNCNGEVISILKPEKFLKFVNRKANIGRIRKITDS